MMGSQHDQSGPDRGFTLVEVVIVVTLLALLTGALALTISVVLRNDDSVTTRITETRDLQNLTNFLPGDVASARVISDTPATSCGSGGTVELHLEWSEEWAGSYFVNRVTYRSFNSPNRLVRFECENLAAPTSFTAASAYDTVSLSIETVPPALPSDPPKPTGTVTAEFTYVDSATVRRLSATSRNFVPTGP